MPTLNLGLVKGLFPQTTPPTRTDVQWLDTSITPNVLKTYNSSSGAWEPYIEGLKVEITSSEFTRPEFNGLTLEQIQTKYRLYRDGGELITLAATTKAGADTLDFGFDYSGPAYFIKYANP